MRNQFYPNQYIDNNRRYCRLAAFHQSHRLWKFLSKANGFGRFVQGSSQQSDVPKNIVSTKYTSISCICRFYNLSYLHTTTLYRYTCLSLSPLLAETCQEVEDSTACAKANKMDLFAFLANKSICGWKQSFSAATSVLHYTLRACVLVTCINLAWGVF